MAWYISTIPPDIQPLPSVISPFFLFSRFPCKVLHHPSKPKIALTGGSRTPCILWWPDQQLSRNTSERRSFATEKLLARSLLPKGARFSFPPKNVGRPAASKITKKRRSCAFNLDGIARENSGHRSFPSHLHYRLARVLFSKTNWLVNEPRTSTMSFHITGDTRVCWLSVEAYVCSVASCISWCSEPVRVSGGSIGKISHT